MMGNSSTAPSCTNMCSVSSNMSAGSNFSFLSLFFDLSGAGFSDMMNHCHVQSGSLGWFGVKIFILLTAFPANAALMMMMLMYRRKSMTPSEVLGFNVSIMDVLYCLSLPLDLYSTLHHTSDSVNYAKDTLFALNVFGCPLLLTFICLERYVAVAQPISYIRLGRMAYRVVLCTCAWILTLTVALLGYFVGLFSMLLCLSVIISLLFLIMLLCLLKIVVVLRQSGPGEGSGSSVPLKRRALKNIVAVTVPAVVAYTPLVALVPYMAVITSTHQTTISPAQCTVLQVLLLFPNFGLFIGPLFYLSRLQQVSCCSKDKQSQTDKIQTE
ncbi:G-protein coupled receptor 35-like [Labrus mixtus]|uniref:G-protein coupled receptor 35-like n=1 Tax=Labrus mixtus TaxID=508554 RepID=UPI0029BFD6AF|nr:G-protein coupled receptor 35-like [Labrus mixtus]